MKIKLETAKIIACMHKIGCRLLIRFCVVIVSVPSLSILRVYPQRDRTGQKGGGASKIPKRGESKNKEGTDEEYYNSKPFNWAVIKRRHVTPV